MVQPAEITLERRTNFVLFVGKKGCAVQYQGITLSLHTHSSNEEDSSSEYSRNEVDVEVDEETIIKYYFQRGFSYEEIILLLAKRHDHEISYSTLLRRLKAYGLSRRGFFKKDDYNEVIDVVRQHIKLDPERTLLRKAHRLKRRSYHNLGPNDTWHMDGYDTLKPFGFPIHGAIDGFSRKILWLQLTRSNNSPDNIATYFLNTVKELKGCPAQLITDLGTENGLAASIQCYFKDNPDAHRYVASPRNQINEGWWSFYSHNRSTWWRKFFRDLELEVLQEDLDIVKEHWNSHIIRKSRHGTVSGRPVSLFYLPEHHGAVGNLLSAVSQTEIDNVSENVVQMNYFNEYQDYFDYARRAVGINLPSDLQEADNLYRKLVVVSEHGD
ncbi:hypothetical protein OS493_037149 [Desmophyllum pertusum]|uniref:Integrase catalytic domain-containing protein n=1 Tax=Desmophyllum pertusum TaxID=174260 RepID=A0A9W9ZLB4_9CNID|nr:hypothetical protein OS493_037149 [Desmophyllum pertusum]